MADLDTSFDYIIVGAGSSGCVVAGRLSQDPASKVCLVEAGGSDASVLVRAPVGIVAIMRSRGRMNWAYDSAPQRALNGRRSYQPRGKLLGGSSSINGMLYVRGNRWDYDHWASLGNEGWSYNEVLPYFKKSENNKDIHNEYHGQGGPLSVVNQGCPGILNEPFLQACEQLGIPRNPDYNGAQQAGCFMYQATQINGERCSAATAYLQPARSRDNLTIVTGATVLRVTFDGGRATGVEVDIDGIRRKLRCHGEVIVSGGTYNSPKLLQLSGIGDGRSLQELGIPLVRDLPGVGENLQDHIDVIHSYRAPINSDTFGVSIPFAARLVAAANEWRRRRTGLMTTTFAEAGAFFCSRDGLEVPDLQLVFARALIDDHGRKIHRGHGFSCHVTLLRPKGRGTVWLGSPNPMDDPMIDARILEHDDDYQRLAVGALIQRKIMESAPLAPWRGTIVYPFNVNDPQELKADILRRVDTQYHPVGTCKMGNDHMAVVDTRLRVHGVQGLRVVDCSIMPTIIGGNTNAPAIMIGEKAADMIRQDARS